MSSQRILLHLQSYHTYSIASNICEHSGAISTLQNDIRGYYRELSVVLLMKPPTVKIAFYVMVDKMP